MCDSDIYLHLQAIRQYSYTFNYLLSAAFFLIVGPSNTGGVKYRDFEIGS